MSTDWTRLDFSLPRASEDLATLRLHEAGVPGWEVVDSGPDRVVLRFWALPEDALRLTETVEAIAGCRRDAVLPQSDAAWTRDWAPQRVGPFVIGSLGGPGLELEPGAYGITLAPALAFGGGEHPTTRLSLLALPGLVTAETSSVLDVGCGSGILAIAAAKLGARAVVATDIDPTARRATARAAAASGVDVHVLEGSLEEAQGPFDLIVANILAPTLIALAPTSIRKLALSGQILLSGVRVGAEAEVLDAYRPLQLRERTESDGWLALRLGAR